MKLNHNQFNLFVACLGFEQLYLDGFVYVIWKYEDCYLLQLMLLNHKHNKFNLVVAWIRTAGKDSYQGLDSNLRNYLYQKRKEVFVVNFIESDIFLVVLRLGVVVPTVTFCNYCQN